ncbi:MAG: hypothetical protein R3B09_08025 [Nannocystaceae bacterium]
MSASSTSSSATTEGGATTETAGTTAGATSSDGSSSGAVRCDGEIATLQAELFAPKCGQIACHDPDNPEGALDLVSPGVDARLVGAPAATCDGWVRVVAGDPGSSLLHVKLAGPVPCGAKMPIGAELDADEIACVDAWIEGATLACETCGGRSCVDLDNDAAHCGGCDLACPGGVACVGGECQCPGGQVVCGDACVDTGSSKDHCGGCDQPCGGGEVCKGGACSASCGDLELCDGGCVDTQIDPGHCGDCMSACAPGTMCVGGQCACGEAVSFTVDVQPIFSARCTGAGCHGKPMPAAGLDLGAGLSYADLVGVASSECANRLRVAPSQPDASYLIDKVKGINLCTGTKMPKVGSLTAEEVATLEAWVCNGAPSN